ncbi:VOC family protein [Nocardioides sp.]|uniref:VOC family protein n=1 Tax=Nocardioides sp. TaxID=35761 RepID=UPI0039E35685
MGIRLRSVVLDTTDVFALAEFYRRLLGWSYPAGYDAAPGADWLALEDSGGRRIAFQQADELAPTTWPDPGVPQQLHLDFLLDSLEELAEHHERALRLGAAVRLDRIDDPEEPLRVYTDPAGHTFCMFTWTSPLD